MSLKLEIAIILFQLEKITPISASQFAGINQRTLKKVESTDKRLD